MVTRLTHLLGCSIGRDKDCILVSFVRSSNNPKNCKSSLLGDWHMINVALTRTKVDICCFDKTGTLTSDDMEFSRVGGLRDDMDLTTDTKKVPTRTLEIIASYHGMVSMHSKLQQLSEAKTNFLLCKSMLSESNDTAMQRFQYAKLKQMMIKVRQRRSDDGCCTDFLEATNDEYIFKYVSMDKFPMCNWVQPSDKVVSFLTRCFEKENAEALFRHGMTEYFKHCNFKSGLEFLKRASEKKHLEATYVYGLFLLSRGDESSSKQGLELLNSLKSSRPGNWNVRDCRDKVGSILSNMFFNKYTGTLQQVYTKCRDMNHDYEFSKRDWDFATREDLSSCDTCMWYRELAFFCKDRRLEFRDH
ncbi:putative F-box protein [Tanacetum coccineum]|uniref:F-box protein n=1 Tax=Tanacetum coccineum TaxID=301880 RepID=A0ABQ5F6N9_9ASTR